jgi:hypothetical protein
VRKRFLILISLMLIASITCSIGQKATVEPGELPPQAEPTSEKESGLWATDDETVPNIVFPKDGQIVWGTINVLLALPGVEVPEAVFAYDGGEGFVDLRRGTPRNSPGATTYCGPRHRTLTAKL